MQKVTYSRPVSFLVGMLLLLLCINSFAIRNAPITTMATKTICPGQSVVVPITVAGFTDITSVSLRIDYNPSIATFTSGTANSALSGIFFNSVTYSPTLASIMISWSDAVPRTLAATDLFIDLTMNYISGSTTLVFNNTSGGGGECEYGDEIGDPMTDVPTATYYINGAINSLAVGVPGSITGTSAVCAGANGVAYSIAAVTNATSYTWSLPSGFTIASGANSNAITADISASAISGNITVTPSNSCGSGSASPNYAVTVNPILPVSVTVASSANPVCSGTSVTFTASPVNGGAAPAYQWKVNGTNVGTSAATYAFVPVNNDVITCVLTSNAAPCATGSPATSNAVTMTVNPNLPVSVTVASSANPVCSGSSVTFTASPVNGGASPVYQWKVNGSNVGTNASTYAYVPVNNDVVTCVLTSNATPCATGNPATSNSITMVISSSLPVSITIAASANPVCAGTSVTFTASPTNGGSTPVYQWKVNGTNVGSGAATYAYVPVNNEVITCVLTSSETCGTGSPATSNALTMTVNPILPVSVTIAASATTVCAGTSVTFTASPVNGGAAPIYQWKVNGTSVGSNAVTYAYIPVNNDVITCVLTSNAAPCATGSPATSNALTMMVNPILPVSVTIAASSTTVCAGTSVTYTATPTNEGSSPSYQWKVNGTNVGTSAATYAYTPSNNDVVSCVLISSETCITGSPATSNAITMTVNALQPVSVTIEASATSVCAGTSVTFTASPTNGGSDPVYQWKVNGTNVGTSAATYAYVPVNNDVITCVLTSNAAPCATGSPATSNAVTMTVNPILPVSVTIASSATTVCAGTSVSYTAAPVNGGAAPAYQWKVNGINVGTNAATYSYAPINNDMITCVLTSNSAPCATGSPATSNAITMVVNPILPVSVTIASSATTVCSGTSVTFTASPTNGGASPVYQWKVNGTNVGSGTATYAYVPVNNDVITCVLISSETCATGSPATSNAITMTVNPNLPVSVSIAASTNPVCSGTSVTLTASPINGGTTPIYQWKVNGTDVGTNTTTYAYVPVNNDVITCILTSNAAPCATGSPATSNALTMVVNQLPVATAANNGPLCEGLTLNLLGTPDGMASYSWTGPNGFTSTQQNPTITNVTAAAAGVYSLIVTNSSGCTSLAVTTTVVINANPTATASNNGPMCEDLTLNLYGQPSGAASYQWTGPNGFTSNVQNPTIANVTAAAAGQYVLIVSNASGCQSVGNTSVTIFAKPATTATNNGPLCVGTILNLLGGPAGMTSYAWTGPNGFTSIVQNPTIASVTAVNAGVFTLLVTNSTGCSASANTTVVVNPVPEAPAITQVGYILTSSATDGNQWYYENNIIAGATQQTYTITHNTGYYSVMVTLNGCTSPMSNKIWIVVDGVSELTESASFNIYPVPNNGSFKASISNLVDDPFTIIVYNQLGEKLYELRDVKTSGGKFETQIDLRPVSDGMYTVVFLNSSYKIVKKVIMNNK